jgi:hypothetical protein
VYFYGFNPHVGVGFKGGSDSLLHVTHGLYSWATVNGWTVQQVADIASWGQVIQSISLLLLAALVPQTPTGHRRIEERVKGGDPLFYFCYIWPFSAILHLRLKHNQTRHISFQFVEFQTDEPLWQRPHYTSSCQRPLSSPAAKFIH